MCRLVGGLRIVAVLVLKYTIQHQELLAATMRVRREPAVRGVADDRGRARYFIADAVEHTPVDPGNRRWSPVQPSCVDGGASIEV